MEVRKPTVRQNGGNRPFWAMLAHGVKPGSLNRWDRWHIIPQFNWQYIPLTYHL